MIRAASRYTVAFAAAGVFVGVIAAATFAGWWLERRER